MEKENLSAKLSSELFSLAATAHLSENPEHYLRAAKIAHSLGMLNYAIELAWEGLYAITIHPDSDIESELMAIYETIRKSLNN